MAVLEGHVRGTDETELVFLGMRGAIRFSYLTAVGITSKPLEEKKPQASIL